MKRIAPWLLATIVLSAIVHVAAVKAFPYYAMLKVKKSGRYEMNAIHHRGRVTAQSRSVVRPSPDLIYSSCGFDIRERPLHISATVPQNAYWSVSMFAINTDNFFVMNDQQTKSKRLEIILVKKGEKLEAVPKDALVIESPSARGVVLFRMLITDKDMVEGLIRVQHEASCRPLE